ncbi:PREDICTED: uncharacterized protein LOC105620003 [Atta cephalotes]|uniref:DDE Tnp4 domain-containing protein n=1 Tax=Atta cephalotes TaxID=12957 RepID=A0A158NH96_ATTCE|nr:PREDICTED: uncharacterized protein LOC105620003 [Atta cephalotes]
MPRFQHNENLCSARSCIKRFGVWKAMFRCLTTQRRLIYEPGMAGKIINACAVLHNMRIAHGIHDDLEIDEMDNEHLDHRINPVESMKISRSTCRKYTGMFYYSPLWKKLTYHFYSSFLPMK